MFLSHDFAQKRKNAYATLVVSCLFSASEIITAITNNNKNKTAFLLGKQMQEKSIILTARFTFSYCRKKKGSVSVVGGA